MSDISIRGDAFVRKSFHLKFKPHFPKRFHFQITLIQIKNDKDSFTQS